MTNSRVCEAGKQLGRVSATLAEHGRKRLADQGLTDLNLPGVRDQMCKTCACQRDSVPNGCLQTQMDFLKAVVDGLPFLCHAPKDGRMCAGYIAARMGHVAKPLPPALVDVLKDWTYSPPDETV